ncbi:MAG: hypothetical protein BWX72_00421 [Firmicutes bacterium ADurb.Bin080]|nr:MAG: hypothetical protein BWX72_00421 [Firmicutes bacterium ADurb.Bin080]
MRQKMSKVLLGVYDLFLSLGAIYIGIMMVSGKGIFSEYPKEWLSKVPFDSWVIPGLVAIVVFGLGNIIAAIFSIGKKGNKSWYTSAIVGVIFFVSLVVQVLVLGEVYLATAEFFVLSLIQLCLCGNVFLSYKKNQ